MGTDGRTTGGSGRIRAATGVRKARIARCYPGSARRESRNWSSNVAATICAIARGVKGAVLLCRWDPRRCTHRRSGADPPTCCRRAGREGRPGAKRPGPARSTLPCCFVAALLRCRWDPRRPRIAATGAREGGAQGRPGACSSLGPCPQEGIVGASCARGSVRSRCLVETGCDRDCPRRRSGGRCRTPATGPRRHTRYGWPSRS